MLPLPVLEHLLVLGVPLVLEVLDESPPLPHQTEKLPFAKPRQDWSPHLACATAPSRHLTSRVPIPEGLRPKILPGWEHRSQATTGPWSALCKT